MSVTMHPPGTQQDHVGRVHRQCLIGTGWLQMTGTCTGIATDLRLAAILRTLIDSN